MSENAKGRGDFEYSVVVGAREGDLFLVNELIEAPDNPLEVASRYISACTTLYTQKKDVQAMQAVGRAGAQYCLTKAIAHEAESELASKLRQNAKVILFNVAANTWPGWDDEGIVITPADIMLGLDAALASLRLVKQLDLGHEQLGNAHWIVGALRLTTGDYNEAIDQFASAEREFSAAELTDWVLLIKGYTALAIMRRPGSGKQGHDALATVLSDLDQVGTDNSTFFRDQLQTADRILTKREAGST